MNKLPHIVIVGGGAGGLELATRLGRTLGARKKAKITLIDENPTHLWKPLLHEVAAGTLDASQDEINYFIHASLNHYYFQLGKMVALNRKGKEVELAPLYSEDQEEVLPSRKISYDFLVLAFGSITNDFGIPGVKENCLFLDSLNEAEHFQQVLLKNLLRLQNRKEGQEEKLCIVIVGGGATGVELAAELHYTAEQAVTYGLDKIDPTKDIEITLIEAGPSILPQLPERISMLATEELHRRKINVITDAKVVSVTPDTLHTAEGKNYQGTMIVWAVGVKTEIFAGELDGLEVNQRNQVVVKQTLQTTRDEAIFAIGDCAACPLGEKQIVPPRAQSANQEAKLLAKSMARYLNNKSLLKFYYKDYGSLVSLSHHNTLASLMGRLMGDILIEGKIARMIYVSLYKKHQIILRGFGWVFLQSIMNFFTRKSRPRLKLH